LIQKDLNMHWIQKDILRKLSKADTLRYSELRPKDVEGNLFMYHRALLVNQGLIKKKEDGYTLTSVGKNLVASLSLSQGRPIVGPRNLVAVVYRRGGEYLFYRWNRQPYRGLVSLPFGRLHAGWKIQDMAAEQLHYKAGLAVESWRMCGTINIQSNGPLGHSLIQVMEAFGLGGTPTADGLTGKPFWGNVKSIDPQDLMTGFGKILTITESHKEIFFEELVDK
jgi:ADP-ribose pyrophosphatase YjhB (NUDIX family)